MKIITSRLTIRNLHPNDWKEIKLIWQDFNSSPYSIYDVSHNEKDDEIKNIVNDFSESENFYLVLLSDSDIVIGTIDLHNTGNGYDIGYCFLSKYQGKGYARESCGALIDLYEKRGCKRFSAGTALKNKPSVNLLLSLGFRQIGNERVTFHKDETGNDIYFEGGIFELLK